MGCAQSAAGGTAGGGGGGRTATGFTSTASYRSAASSGASAAPRDSGLANAYLSNVCDELYSPAAHRRMSTLSLRKIIESEALRESFSNYIEATRHAGAHRKVRLWCDAVAHEMLPYDPVELRLASAQRVYDTYFADTDRCCRELELDADVVADIARALRVRPGTGQVRERRPARLRSAFGMAAGRVFSDLKYMYMPRYLESLEFRALVQSGEASSSPQNAAAAYQEFQAEITHQRMPCAFVLSKPHTADYLLQFIATMPGPPPSSGPTASAAARGGHSRAHRRRYYLRVIDLRDELEDMLIAGGVETALRESGRFGDGGDGGDGGGAGDTSDVDEDDDRETCQRAQRRQQRHARVLKRFPVMYKDLLRESWDQVEGAVFRTGVVERAAPSTDRSSGAFGLNFNNSDPSAAGTLGGPDDIHTQEQSSNLSVSNEPVLDNTVAGEGGEDDKSSGGGTASAGHKVPTDGQLDWMRDHLASILDKEIMPLFRDSVFHQQMKEGT